jgi:hypothetical protein
MQTQKRTAVVEPIQHCLEAWLWQAPTIANDILEVLRSPMVETTDDWYSPISNFLTDRCSREINWDTKEDPDFFLGECIRTEYRIYPECPGERVEHNCAKMRRNDQWLNTGQSVS